MSGKPRGPKAFPLRIRLERGRVAHAGWTGGLYIPGAGLTACGTQYEPRDTQLPADEPVTCGGCNARKSVKEAASA